MVEVSRKCLKVTTYWPQEVNDSSNCTLSCIPTSVLSKKYYSSGMLTNSLAYSFSLHQPQYKRRSGSPTKVGNRGEPLLVYSWKR